MRDNNNGRNGIFLRGWLPHRGKAQMACNYCINRSIWTCRRSNDLWQDSMKWWTFGYMKNGLGIYECHGQLERFRNGSSRAFTPQSQPDPFRNRSTAITSRGGRLVPERPDAVEQVWTRAPGCVPERFRSQSCGVNTALDACAVLQQQPRSLFRTWNR